MLYKELSSWSDHSILDYRFNCDNGNYPLHTSHQKNCVQRNRIR